MKFNVKQPALKFTLALIFALGGGMYSVNSYAATATGTFGVTATVAASCTVSGTTLAFGAAVDVLGPDVDATSTITATCTSGAAYSVGLDAGATTGATVTTRQMQSGVNLLNYALYRDAGRTLNWGVTTGAGGDVATGTGTGAAQALTVYGRIPTGQTTVPAGAYSDTIVATITF